jgi:hypothetical protein
MQFGVDAVGTGRGVAAIIAGEWSSAIQRFEATGKPTDRPASTADGRPAHEVYDRAASEFWYSTREILQGGQLCGLYPAAITQLCTRKSGMKGRKYWIEDKVEFKMRLKRSPDDADCCVILTEVARRNGLAFGTPIVKRLDSDWNKQLAEADSVHDDAYQSDGILDEELDFA